MIGARAFGERESADSMAAAAARLGVPLSVIKHYKRQGCPAFRGSRVYLRPLAEMIVSGETETDTILLPIPTGLEASGKTFSARSKRELEEYDKLTHTIHLGFGVASCLLDRDATDEYLRRTAAALERA